MHALVTHSHSTLDRRLINKLTKCPLQTEKQAGTFFVIHLDLENIKGRLCAGPTLTKQEFLLMTTICLNAPHGFVVHQLEDNQPLPDNDDLLERGIYVVRPIQTSDEVQLSTARYYMRCHSFPNLSRDANFSLQVKRRDQKCVVSGLEALDADVEKFDGWKAAHIIPVAHKAILLAEHPDIYITDKKGTESGINSAQNGLMLQCTLHKWFDQYRFAVNPFMGTYLFQCRQAADPHRVSDRLLWRHFQQAVLANMRGAGEPVFRDDFSPGSDQVGEILRGPNPGAHIEFQLATRLHLSNIFSRHDRDKSEERTQESTESDSLLAEESSNVHKSRR